MNKDKERDKIRIRNIMNEDKEIDKMRKGMVKENFEKFERPNSEKKEVTRRKLDVKDEIGKDNNNNDSLKEMMEKHNNKEEASSVQIICKKLEKESSLKQDIERQKSLRASTLAHVNLSSISHGKSYFFYFTHLFLHNTHISLSIIQDILYK